MLYYRVAIPVVVALLVCAGSVLSDPVPATRPARPANRYVTRYLSEMKGHADTVKSLAVSADGKRVVSGSDDMTVRVWDLATGKQLHCFEGHTSSVRSVAFSPDGKLVASGSDDRTARVWDLEAGRPVCQFDRASDRVNCVAFSASGKSLLTGSCDMDLRIWSIADDKLLREIRMSSCVYFLAASKDDSRIACGMHDGSVVVIDGASGRNIVSFKAAARTGLDALAINADGSRLVSHSYAEGLALWELPSGRQLVTLDTYGGASGCAIAPGDKMFALASGQVNLHNMTTGQLVRSYRPEMRFLHAAVFTPDGKQLLTAGERGVRPEARPIEFCGIQVWDLAAGPDAGVDLVSLFKADPTGWTDVWPDGKLEGWSAYDWPPGPAAAAPAANPAGVWTWDRDNATFRTPSKGSVQWLSDRDYADFTLHFEYRAQQHGGSKFQTLVRMQPGQMVCNSIEVNGFAPAVASSAIVRDGVVEWQPAFMLHPRSGKWQSVYGTCPNGWRQVARKDKRTQINSPPMDLGPGGPTPQDLVFNWNNLDIVAKADTISCYANGTLVSRCTGVPTTTGRIGFFTENTDVELFNVLIKPLKP